MTLVLWVLAIVGWSFAAAGFSAAVAAHRTNRALLDREKELLDRIQAPAAAAMSSALRLGERSGPARKPKSYARSIASGVRVPARDEEDDE